MITFKCTKIPLIKKKVIEINTVKTVFITNIDKMLKTDGFFVCKGKEIPKEYFKT
jgi:hypothetical protein